MFRIGTNIIGVGTVGSEAVAYAMEHGVDGAGYACVMAGRSPVFDICCEDRNDFLGASDRIFVNKNGVAFVVADFSDRVVSSMTCEVCAISRTMGSLTIALVYMPSSLTDEYDEAMDYVEELHSLADGVVIINSGYADDFGSEVYVFLQMLADAMCPDGARNIPSGDELGEILSTERNIYFATVSADKLMDSHEYHSKALSMRLECQTHIDVATNFAYFITCGSDMPRDIMSRYVNAVDKKNIAYMPVKRAYIYENNPRLDAKDFVFGVLCSQ